MIEAIIVTNIRSSKRASQHFVNACGRMYTIAAMILVFIYMANYAGQKLDLKYITEIVQTVVGILIMTMFLWPALYVKNHFGMVYRFFILRMREYNIVAVDAFFLPGMVVLLMFWAWIELLSYYTIIKQFMENGTVRPILILLAGFMFLFMFIILMACRYLAGSRGVNLDKPNPA